MASSKEQEAKQSTKKERRERKTHMTVRIGGTLRFKVPSALILKASGPHPYSSAYYYRFPEERKGQ